MSRASAWAAHGGTTQRPEWRDGDVRAAVAMAGKHRDVRLHLGQSWPRARRVVLTQSQALALATWIFDTYSEAP